jgi:hypothetical protein
VDVNQDRRAMLVALGVSLAEALALVPEPAPAIVAPGASRIDVGGSDADIIDFQLRTESTMIDVTTASSPGPQYVQGLARTYLWFKCYNFSAILQAFQQNVPLPFTYTLEGRSYTANVMVTSLRVLQEVDALAVATVEARVVGGLVIAEVPLAPVRAPLVAPQADRRRGMRLTGGLTDNT